MPSYIFWHAKNRLLLLFDWHIFREHGVLVHIFFSVHNKQRNNSVHNWIIYVCYIQLYLKSDTKWTDDSVRFGVQNNREREKWSCEIVELPIFMERYLPANPSATLSLSLCMHRRNVVYFHSLFFSQEKRHRLLCNGCELATMRWKHSSVWNIYWLYRLLNFVN